MKGGNCVTCRSDRHRSQYSDEIAFEGEAIAQHIETAWAASAGEQHTARLAALVRSYSGAPDQRSLEDHFAMTVQGRLALIVGTLATVGHYWIASQAGGGPMQSQPLMLLAIGAISTLITSRIANCLAMSGCDVLAWLSLLSPMLDLAIVYVTLMPQPEVGHPNFPPEARQY